MKGDQEQSGGALVSSAGRALTKNSTGLIRRGLEDLLNGQSRLNSSAADKVPRLTVGQKVFTSCGSPGEVAKVLRNDDQGPAYTLIGSAKVAAKPWRENELTEFDEAKCAKAEALFEAGMKHCEGEDLTPADSVRALVKWLHKNHGLDGDQIIAMKPYIIWFFEARVYCWWKLPHPPQDLAAGKIELSLTTAEEDLSRETRAERETKPESETTPDSLR